MNCPNCHANLPNNAISCPYCAARWGQPQYFQQNDTNDKLVSYLIPTQTTMLSMAAGYLGLFAPLIIPAPFAFILGIIALTEINKRQKKGEKIGGKGRAIFAIVTGTIFTLLLLTFLVLLVFSPS